MFDARQTVSVRDVGDFVNRIQSVFVDLEYNDTANNYVQTKSFALVGAGAFLDWTIPVINEKAGKVTYKATVTYKDGTNETIPPTVATSNTILLPPAVESFLDVQVITDVLDWDEVRLVRVALSYTDAENRVSQSKDLIFSPANKANTTWRVELKNGRQDRFTYAITYYLVSGLQKTVGPINTKDRALILDHAQHVERATLVLPVPVPRPVPTQTVEKRPALAY